MRNHYLWVRRTHTINVISGKIMQSWAGQNFKIPTVVANVSVFIHKSYPRRTFNVRFSFMRIRTVVQMLQKPAIWDINFME